LRLREDHQVVLRRLTDFTAALDAVGDPPSDDILATVRDVLAFVEYEVWTHFTIEEEALFPLLTDIFPAENAPVVGGPVFVLTQEHSVLRRLVAQMEAKIEAWLARDEGATESLLLTSRQTIRAFQKHIYKEDNIVFRLAETMMTDDQMVALDAAAARMTVVHDGGP
jgi:hemerythrin-like domain-containing protein